MVNGTDRRRPGTSRDDETGLSAHLSKNMEVQHTKVNLTGPGTVGGPRPGEGGMQRVPPPSLSGNRREKQVLDQACSSHRVTDPLEDRERRYRVGVAMSDSSSSDDSFPVKRRKWTFSPPSLSMSETEMSSNRDKETRRKSGKPSSSSRSRGSNWPPSLRERLTEARNMPSTTLIDSLIEVADSLDEMANSAGDLRGAFVRRLRDHARRTRANAIELARRMDTAAVMAAVEQETSQPRVRLPKADQEIGDMETLQQEKEDTERGICSKMLPTVHRAEPVADPKIDKLVSSNVTEIRALAEQFQALGESESAGARDDRPIGQTQDVRPEPAGPEMELPSNENEGKTEVREQSVMKSARNQQSAEPQGCSTPDAADSATTWVEVVGRREKNASKKADKATQRKVAAPREQRERAKRPTPMGTSVGKKPKINPPRRAAVAITLAPGSNKTCGEVLAAARAKIRLSEIGGPVANVRQTMTGGILLEIAGEDRSAKADKLAAKLREVFAKEEEVKISRPQKKAEIRIRGLDISIQPRDVKEAVAAAGGCTADEVKVGEIQRRSPRGTGAAWVQCPAPVAKALVDKDKIVIGWVLARVEALRARPMTCFRCLQQGHTANACTSTRDRSADCYNCGKAGHRARECTSPPKCPVCFDAGRASNHRFGSRACKSPGALQRAAGKASGS